LQELSRRAQDRQTSTMLDYTRSVRRLTLIVTMLTLVNMVIAVIPLIRH
jgi:hypothetical protein